MMQEPQNYVGLIIFLTLTFFSVKISEKRQTKTKKAYSSINDICGQQLNYFPTSQIVPSKHL